MNKHLDCNDVCGCDFGATDCTNNIAGQNFQLKILKWAIEKHLIIEYSNDNYSFSDCGTSFYITDTEDEIKKQRNAFLTVEGETDENYGTLWNRLLIEVITHVDCPSSILIGIIVYGDPYKLPALFNLKIRKTVLSNPNFKKNLNHIGFGLLEDTTSKKLVCQIDNGDLCLIRTNSTATWHGSLH